MPSNSNDLTTIHANLWAEHNDIYIETLNKFDMFVACTDSARVEAVQRALLYQRSLLQNYDSDRWYNSTRYKAVRF